MQIANIALNWETVNLGTSPGFIVNQLHDSKKLIFSATSSSFLELKKVVSRSPPKILPVLSIIQGSIKPVRLVRPKEA